MMWILITFGLLLISMDAYAQRRGGFGGQAPRSGNPISIKPSSPAYARPPIRQILVPYAVPYPVYAEGGYSVDNPQIEAGNGIEAPYPYPPQSPNALIAPAREQISQPTTFNQNMPKERQGVVPEGAATNVAAPTCPAEPARSDPPQLFIALKDHWVYTAIAFWVESGTLHYVTSRGSHNQVSLDLVDRRLSQELNAGRRVDFVLPPD